MTSRTRAVRVGGDDAHLLARADLLHHGVVREDFDAGDARRLEVELGAIGDPGAEDFVIFLAELGALAAFVRHAGGGLQEHERVVGRGGIQAAPGEVVLERAHVEKRIVAAERELEAELALLRAVAGAGVAAELGHHGVHVADEIDRLECFADR